MKSQSPAANVIDRPAATSSLPEPFLSEHEPFLVYSRIEIEANLRALIDDRVLATVYFSEGASFIVTRFLDINPDLDELIFDQAPDVSTNRRMQASGGFIVVAFLDHVKVQFTVSHAELTQFQGAPAFRVRTPASILRLQRRTAFRAHTKLTPSPYLVLSSALDKSGTPNAGRLRIADISATGFAFVAPKGRPELTAGMFQRGSVIELSANESFVADVEIRHVAIFKDAFGREICRAGCRLLQLTGSAEMAVQRYVNKLAVARRDRL